MDDSQSTLVLISGAFSTVMFVLLLVKGPRISPFTKAKFSTKELPTFLRFLVGVVCASIVVGLFFKLDLLELGQYILLNFFIGSGMGAGLWLFHDTKPDKDKSHSDQH
jgi:hypothetical protein